MEKGWKNPVIASIPTSVSIRITLMCPFGNSISTWQHIFGIMVSCLLLPILSVLTPNYNISVYKISMTFSHISNYTILPFISQSLLFVSLACLSRQNNSSFGEIVKNRPYEIVKKFVCFRRQQSFRIVVLLCLCPSALTMNTGMKRENQEVESSMIFYL